MGGGVEYGETSDPEALASLFVEDMPDLMAATCLPRRTLYALRHGSTTPKVETWAALQEGMHLLDPDDPRNIVGWRDALPTAEALAEALECEPDRARRLRSGKVQWTPEERARLIAILRTRHA
jgi:hypothetical protein